ncbi:hypothetical protein BJ138DRAFT_1145116 [Hygrophoropsis aurantiaca]|uniref:Uncharacterized protein n=1 Tax=Hygrophoropsis aurantiaca TaxID=72124 RepID=A0ACB8ALE7_9AGAM|nr:hypothetical protein BJ138DRAFT_1145116 [Hygrophoropsis aurantiaca]
MSASSRSTVPSRPTTRSMDLPGTRRSQRLNGGTQASEPVPKTRTNRRKSNSSNSSPLPSKRMRRGPENHVKTVKKPKVQVSGSNDDMPTDDEQLTSKETDLRRTIEELEERLADISKREKEVAALCEERKDHSANAALKQLDDHFTCPLCLEFMACPYSLNSRRCGHTFCGTCILKWFFSRVHTPCATWHEAVECPMCRTQLHCTPDHIPRPESTFPFTPNRTVDSVIRSLISALSEGSGSDLGSATNPLIEWKAGGYARQGWEKRDVEGRNEMEFLGALWNTMKAKDVLNIKARLEV